MKLLRNKIGKNSKKLKLKNKLSEKTSKIKTFKNKTISNSTWNPNKPNIIPNWNKCIKNINLTLEKEPKSIKKPSMRTREWLSALMDWIDRSTLKSLKLTCINWRFFSTRRNAALRIMPWGRKKKIYLKTIRNWRKRWIVSERKKKEG